MAAASAPSLTARAFSGALWTASGWGLSAVLQLAFGIAMARILGPEILGLYAAALVVIRFSNVWASIGIGPALVQREDIETRHLRTGLALSVALSFGIAGVVWLGANAIASFYRMPELGGAIRTLSLVLPLRGLAVVPLAMLQRELRFRRLAGIDAFAYFFGFGLVGVFLALSGVGLDSLIVATVTHAALELVLLLWSRPFPLTPLASWSSARELIRFGGGVTLARIFGFLALQGDKLIVGRLLGAGPLGLYSRSYSLVSASTRLYQKIAVRAFFPLLSRVQTDRERLGRGFRRGLALSALSVLPSSAALFALAPDLIHALLGSEWLGAIAPFRVLVLFAFLRSTAKLCGPLVMAVGKVYRLAWIQAAFAVFVVVGAVLGANGGVRGVAIGVAAAIVGQSILLLRSSLRLAGVSWVEVFQAWLRPAVLALLLGGYTWLVIGMVRSRVSISLGVVTITLTVVGLTVALVFLFAPRLLLGEDSLSSLRQLHAFRSFEEKVLRRIRPISK